MDDENIIPSKSARMPLYCRTVELRWARGMDPGFETKPGKCLVQREDLIADCVLGSEGWGELMDPGSVHLARPARSWFSWDRSASTSCCNFTTVATNSPCWSSNALCDE